MGLQWFYVMVLIFDFFIQDWDVRISLNKLFFNLFSFLFLLSDNIFKMLDFFLEMVIIFFDFPQVGTLLRIKISCMPLFLLGVSYFILFKSLFIGLQSFTVKINFFFTLINCCFKFCLLQLNNLLQFSGFFFIEGLFYFFLFKWPNDAHTEWICLILHSIDVQTQLLAITLQFHFHFSNDVL